MTDKAASFNQKPGVGRHVRSILVLNSLIARNVYRQIVAAEDFAATGDAAAGEALDLADRRVEPLKTSPVGAIVAPKNEAHGCRPCAALATITGPHFHIPAPNLQVLVRISDLTVIVGESRPAQIAAAIAWARAHRESLALNWAELNERG